MSNDAFRTHQDSWAEIVRESLNDPTATEARSFCRHFLAGLLSVIAGAKARPQVSAPVQQEGMRILSISVRRFHGLIAAADGVHPELINDQCRALMELLFQAFYLLRASDRRTAALDAINLSLIRFSRKSDRLVDDGHLNANDVLSATQTPRAELENEIFPKYDDRRPALYGDLGISQLAARAGLSRPYEMLYSALSALAHSEPSTDLKPVLRQDEKTVELAVIPSAKHVGGAWAFAKTATALATLGGLGALALFADPNKDRARVVLGEFRRCHAPGDWDAELNTLASEWQLK